MKFAELAEYFQRIEVTSSRNEMMEVLSELFGKTEEQEMEQVVNLSLGQLRPKFDRLEFSLAEKMVLRALSVAAKVPVEEVGKEYKRLGDVGELAEKLGKSGSAGLSVTQVYEELEKTARDCGMGSQERKVIGLAKLLNNLEPVGARYVVRIVLGKLRLGFSDKTVLDALSYMEHKSKEGRGELDRAYQVFPDVGKIARYVKEVGTGGLSGKVRVVPGTPVLPALAQRLKTADEMVEKMGEVVVEPKFDGTRVQIHFVRNRAEEQAREAQGGLFEEEMGRGGWVRSYTRNLDENSQMFPELRKVAEEVVAEEVILDAEAVGYDPGTGKMLPFQMTITRKRKHGVKKAEGEVPLKFYVFDMLYVDGESMLDKPLLKRREVLERVVKGGGVLHLDDYLVTKEPEQIREYHARQLAEGLEGAMVKKVGGKYLPGRQDWNWVKFKEVEGSEAKLSDTLDLVVMGYYRGRGKRAKFGLGAFLAGLRRGEKIVTVAKIGTGLRDEEFVEISERLAKLECEQVSVKERYVVEKSLTPDVWVKPELIVEVAADEVTVSPVHTSGYALRFPRLVKFRDDKDLAGATSLEELVEVAGMEAGSRL